MKFFKVISKGNLKKTVETGGCGECQSSCQSACKTSCTVGNQGCENYLSTEDIKKQEEVFVKGLL